MLFIIAWRNRADMKLNVDVLRYLSSDDFRVLTAVEMGMRNHEIVPVELVDRIAALRYGGTYKVLKNLLRHKLLHHDSSKYDGYRLTYLGYDFLAIKTLVNRGVITAVGRQIGVGKESDIFEVETEDAEGKIKEIKVMKLHRLGRVSFRAVKSKRDYLRHPSSYNWLYLSRLAALKEFTFMRSLKDHGFPVPGAIDCNRHCVIMDLVPGYPLVQVKQLQNPEVVFETIMSLIVRLAEHGLIHCDFNEFNIMIDDDEKVTMIDFPQMVSVNHKNAQAYFDRDVECIFRFNLRFEQRLVEHDGTDSDDDENVDGRPCLTSISVEAVNLDKELAASGFTKKDQDAIDRFIEAEAEGNGDDSDPGSDDEVTTDEQNSIEELKETETRRLDSCSLQVQDDEGLPSEAYHVPAPSSSGVMDAQDSDDDDQDPQPDFAPNDNGEEGEEKVDDVKLIQQLNKQRRRAVASAHGGRHRSFSSRNSYKDKGGKSSQNSKLKKQMSAW
ncbi:Serine/threonine-protein kinase rio2-like protein [Drosera capensis]